MALCETTGISLPPAADVKIARSVACARELLGEGAFTAAWTTGLALPLEEVVAEAWATAEVVEGRLPPSLRTAG